MVETLSGIPPGSPPLAPVASLAAELERAGVVCALGGSGLLMALGLADRANDWDLTTDEPVERVVAAVRPRPYELVGSDALHADRKLVLADLRAEIIIGFAFHTEGGVVRIRSHPTGRWNGLQLAGPEGWAAAYALLGREAKAALLFDWLARRGARHEVIDELLAQPLPPGLASRLRTVRSAV